MEASALPSSLHTSAENSRHWSRRTSSSVELPRFPNGHCNFRHPGDSAHACGCRQFWLNDVVSSNTHDADTGISGGAWCFCGHHACFHTTGGSPRGLEEVDSMLDYDGQPSKVHGFSNLGDGEAKGHRRRAIPTTGAIEVRALDLSTRLDQPFQSSRNLVRSMSALSDHRTAYNDRPASYTYGPPQSSRRAHLDRDRSCSVQQPRSYITESQRPVLTIPAAPSYPRPRSRIPQTVNGRASNDAVPVSASHSIARSSYAVDELAMNPTEVAITPSHSGTPIARQIERRSGGVSQDERDYARANAPCVSTLDSTTPHSATIEYVLSQIASLRALLPTERNASSSLSALRHRLDVLEYASYSRGPDDELQDMVELLEGRVIDTEEKLEELERFRASQIDSQGSLSSFHEEVPSQQAGSFLASHGLDPDSRLSPLVNLSHETAINCIEEFEQRLHILESAATPTFVNPWEIEVVMLPWGRDLKGIWCSPEDAPETPSSSAPTSRRSAAGESFGRALEDWGGESSHWLAPRACGPTSGSGGKVYERLKSRGLVRNIIIHHNGAREVQQEIAASFGEVLETLNKAEVRARPSSSPYLGLQAPFIPLRKVHKSSRLRFLSAAELMTPSLWTAEFLNSSVFMKAPSAGLRRLFVTQSAAYFQHPSFSFNHEWTWESIKGFPVTASISSDANMGSDGESDLDHEPYWNRDFRLDVEIVKESSFKSAGTAHHGSFSSWPSPPPEILLHEFPSESDGRESDSDNSNVDDPFRAATPVSIYHGSRATRVISDPRDPSSARLAEMRHTSPNHHAGPAVPSFSKRRRHSRPPASNDGDMAGQTSWTLTPRLSHEPSSPVSRLPGVSSQGTYRVERSQLPAIASKGGVTPLAYATPYSNFNDVHHDMPIGGDTDMDSDSNDDFSRPPRRPANQRSSEGSEMDDDDDEDSHEDEQIFEEWARKADDDNDDDVEDDDDDDSDEDGNMDEDMDGD